MPDDIVEKYDKLLFGVRRSIRYNSWRESHFDRFSKLVVFSGLIFGSATIATFSAELGKALPLHIKLLPAVFVSILSAIDLIVGSAQKARLHNNLVRDFCRLEKDLELGGEDITPQFVREMTARRLDIEANEPPVLKVLDTICHNELLRAMGHTKDSCVPVSWLQRFFAPVFDFREHTLFNKSK